MYDIAIIGLGPAGATLARLIGKDLKVLAIDRRDLIEPHNNNGFEKCCGGLLAPDAQEMLAKFRLGLPKEIMVGPQLFAVRAIDVQNSLEAYYQRHYINVDREKFDRWLVSLIPESVDISLKSIFKSYEKDDNKIKINYVQNGEKKCDYAKVLVGADGAFSRVRKLAFPEYLTPKTYISIQEYFEVDEISPCFSAIFDEEVSDFYSWVIPKENILILGAAFLPEDDTNTKFNLLKTHLIKFGFNFNSSIRRNGAYLLRPEKVNQLCTGNKNIALIGEAAGFISPSSAEGLSYGFKSAFTLAQSLKRSLNNVASDYDNNISYLKRNIQLKNIKSPFMYNSYLRKVIINSGLKSIKIFN